MIVKICGLQQPSDVRVAIEAGADAIGLVLCASPRQVDLDTAATLLAEIGPGVAKVAVVRRPTPSLLAQIVDLGFDVLQADPDWRPSGASIPWLPAFTDGPDLISRVRRWHVQHRGWRDLVLVDGPRGGGLGEPADRRRVARLAQLCAVVLAGGLDPEGVGQAIGEVRPAGVDVSSGVEHTRGVKDPARIRAFVQAARQAIGPPPTGGTMTVTTLPDARGRFGRWGGRYVPETLVPALEQLTEAAIDALADDSFQARLSHELATWVGRPTPLTEAPRLSQAWGVEVWLKREDLAHTGAHKINNAMGQALLAQRMGATRVVAETGAGQHGVATAAACARLGLPCVVYMGAVDVARQAPNVQRMRWFGAEIVAVHAGDATLRAAIDEALRDWVSDPQGTFYLLGSAVGPHPYPWLVRELQAVIGREAREQILDRCGGLPDIAVACVGGGSNAIGLFHPFVDDPQVALLGVEAGGTGPELGCNAATLDQGTVGVLHGTMSMLLQDPFGQVRETHSVSAGLDYSGVGPEHAWLQEQGRATYVSVTDDEALDALEEVCRLEGILLALETSHAVAGARRWAADNPGKRVLIGASGRGDKDLDILMGVRPATESS